jgi:N-acetylglucosamine kinase-like BadF-type ATPase
MVQIQDQSRVLAGIDRSQHERDRKYTESRRKFKKRVTGENDAKNAMRGEIWNGSRTVTVQDSLF